MGCHSLLQGICLTQGSNLCLCTAGRFFITKLPHTSLKKLWLLLSPLTPLRIWRISQWCKCDSVFSYFPTGNSSTNLCLHLNTIILTSGGMNYIIFSKIITCILSRHNPKFTYLEKMSLLPYLV